MSMQNELRALRREVRALWWVVLLFALVVALANWERMLWLGGIWFVFLIPAVLIGMTCLLRRWFPFDEPDASIPSHEYDE